MSEPKFKAGDPVLLWSTQKTLPIPSVIVRCLGFKREDEPAYDDWVIGANGYHYETDYHRCVHEKFITPMRPDEYTEPTTESREVSA